MSKKILMLRKIQNFTIQINITIFHMIIKHQQLSYELYEVNFSTKTYT